MRALDVARRVADRPRVLDGNAARALARDTDQVDAVLGIAAEGSLAVGEEPRETETLHPCPRNRLRIAGHEHDPGTFRERPQGLGPTGCGLPVGRVRVGQQLEVAPGDALAPPW